MSKKVKVLISVVVAVLVLTVGATTVVMAQDNGSTSTSNTTGANGLLARVADKLGISQEELTDAFNQARQEIRQEMRQDCPSADSGSGDGNMWNKRWHSAFGMRGDSGGWHWQGQCQQGNGA